MSADGQTQNRRYGFGVRADIFDPMAAQYPALRKDPKHLRNAVLTVASDGGLEFVACDDARLPRLLYAPAGTRRLWRAETEAEAKEMASRWTEDEINANLAWGIEAYAVPDEQAMLRIVQDNRQQDEMRRLSASGRPFEGFDRCDGAESGPGGP